MRNPTVILALCLASLLGACAQAPANQPAVISFQSSNESLLEDAERILALPVEAQQKELGLIEGNNAQRDNQIKSSMIYALTHSQYCSVNTTASAKSSAQDTTCAQKWEKERQALNKQLKDSTEENHKLAQKVRDEQARADNLQQKLDELKNIERAMGTREQGTRK